MVFFQYFSAGFGVGVMGGLTLASVMAGYGAARLALEEI